MGHSLSLKILIEDSPDLLKEKKERERCFVENLSLGCLIFNLYLKFVFMSGSYLWKRQ